MRKSRILILLYGHPEYYPPTLNAIDCLAKEYDSITVLHRPLLNSKWNYPPNVTLKSSGKTMEVKTQERASSLNKIWYQLEYFFLVCKELISQKYGTILMYDHVATLPIYLIKPFLRKNVILWYHNHDVPYLNNIKKYSLGYWSIKAQNLILKKCQLFSLPTADRLKYFKLGKRVKTIVIPNYPSKSRYKNLDRKLNEDEQVQVIYQGGIGEGRGILEFAEVISNSVNLKDTSLSLVGKVSSQFKTKLDFFSKDKVIQLGYVHYSKLPVLTSKFHIGLATLQPDKIIYRTGAFASNKIYEYAACGLPVLYFDCEDYNKYLSNFEWAFPTDLSEKSIVSCITEIMSDYDNLSMKAKEEFNNELNFERKFQDIIEYLKSIL